MDNWDDPLTVRLLVDFTPILLLEDARPLLVASKATPEHPATSLTVLL